MKAISSLPRRAVIIIAAATAIIVITRLLWPESRPLALPSPEVTNLPFASQPISPIPEISPNLNIKKAALGNLLFHETSLSQDNTVACAGCHQLARGGVDGTQFSVGVKGQVSTINTPTVFNSVFNFRQFWDGRAKSLHEQIADSIHNSVGMASSWTEVIVKLKQDSAYVTAFAKNYSNGITSENVSDALAAFLDTLITPNSRFDHYLKGDPNVLTPYELSGYALFTSYGCIACHQGINIGGNMYEKLGIMGDYFKDRGNLTQADQGRYALTKNPEDMHVFKVPSLRNIALTAPYLHDGMAQTLHEAVSIMGKYQRGILLPHDDVSRMVAFLHTLTGEYNGKPL